MRTSATTALVLVLGLAAAGCADRSHMGAHTAGICSPFPAATTTTTTTNGVPDPTAPAANAVADASTLDDCLHRCGYRLAKADDTGTAVAGAVVAACSTVLSRWNQASLNQPQTGPDQAVSLVTGETNNTPQDRYKMAEAKALFYVEQGRAGNCSAP
jgi:hypothetical protein